VRQGGEGAGEGQSGERGRQPGQARKRRGTQGHSQDQHILRNNACESLSVPTTLPLVLIPWHKQQEQGRGPEGMSRQSWGVPPAAGRPHEAGPSGTGTSKSPHRRASGAPQEPQGPPGGAPAYRQPPASRSSTATSNRSSGASSSNAPGAPCPPSSAPQASRRGWRCNEGVPGVRSPEQRHAGEAGGGCSKEGRGGQAPAQVCPAPKGSRGPATGAHPLRRTKTEGGHREQEGGRGSRRGSGLGTRGWTLPAWQCRL